MNTNQNTLMLVFPGQGSQYLGIGGDLYKTSPAARAIYERAGKAIGYDVHEMSCSGGDDIHLTRHTQPLLLTHSMACLAALNEALSARVGAAAEPIERRALCAAGHSLGEYSALVSADSLDLEAAVQLVGKRGELMSHHGSGEMLALSLDLQTVQPLAERHHCGIAACNLADQTVVGGHPHDLESLQNHLHELYPKKRFARLKTEGAFHTFYMTMAARSFREVLDHINIRPPRLKVLSNYNGGFHEEDESLIKARLFYQLFNPVLWHANLRTAITAGVTHIIEFGGGIGGNDSPDPSSKRPNLEGIIKKATRRDDHPPTYHAVINEQTLTATVEALSH